MSIAVRQGVLSVLPRRVTNSECLDGLGCLGLSLLDRVVQLLHRLLFLPDHIDMRVKKQLDMSIDMRIDIR